MTTIFIYYQLEESMNLLVFIGYLSEVLIFINERL